MPNTPTRDEITALPAGAEFAISVIEERREFCREMQANCGIDDFKSWREREDECTTLIGDIERRLKQEPTHADA